MPNITILTAGSRGDVQPYLALAIGLREAGHAVRLATHDIFREWITSYGIDHFTVEGNPREMVEEQQAQDWLETGLNGIRFLTIWRERMGRYLEKGMADAYEAAAGADMLIASPLAYYAVHTVSEKTGKAWLPTFLQPVHPTTAFPSPIFPTPFKLGGWFNYLTHAVGGQLSWQLFRASYNRVRRQTFGLKAYSLFGPYLAVDRARIPVLYAFSSHFIARPANWGDHIHITGYWFLAEGKGWQPPDDLAAFLAAGPPPVYVGFGSMATRDPEASTRLVLSALQKAGQRGILLTGWQGLKPGDVPATVCVIESAPHDWLFPRTAAVVHHGGAGTTAAGLQAGVPSIIVPFFGDQPWWADRVHEAGVGPAPIARADVTVDKLAEAIRVVVRDETIRRRAVALGERIRAEDGVQAAVRLIEERLA